MQKEKKRRVKESFMQGVLAIMFSQVLIKILGLAYKLYLTNREGFGDEGNAIYGAGFQIYACFRSSAECKNVCDGTGIYAFHIRFLYLELDKSKLQYRQRGLEGVESSAGRRTCKQHRTCVHSSYKLCVLLHDRLAVLRQLGQRQQRSLAVREYGIRTRGNDVYTSHFQQINL